MIVLLEASMGEKMMEAAVNTLVGMGSVFCSLIVISLIISGFSVIPKIQRHFEEKSEEKHLAKTAPKPDVTEVIDYSSEEIVYEDDTELVAVITASIMSYMGEEAPKDGLKVRSIRKVNNKWKKA